VQDKYALQLLAAVLMGFDAITPLFIPDQLSSTWWRAAALFAFFLAITCLWRQGVLLSREDKENKKQQQERDARIERQYSELVKEFPPGVSGSRQESKELPLQEKAIKLGHDLFSFLGEIEPPNLSDRPKSFEDVWKRLIEVKTPYAIRVRDGYVSKFGDRVIEVARELEAAGIKNLEIENVEINPPEAVRSGDVRKIADSLFLAAARMGIKEASKGTKAAS
jgi:hypothetical protein